jgi:hypothetical protein
MNIQSGTLIRHLGFRHYADKLTEYAKDDSEPDCPPPTPAAVAALPKAYAGLCTANAPEPKWFAPNGDGGFKFAWRLADGRYAELEVTDDGTVQWWTRGGPTVTDPPISLIRDWF